MADSGLAQMAVETSEIVKGLVIDRRLKLSGIMKMEERFGLSFDQFNTLGEKVKSLRDMVDIVVILAQQHDKKISAERVKELLDSDDAVNVLRSITTAFTESLRVESKNLSAPESATATAPRHQ